MLNLHRASSLLSVMAGLGVAWSAVAQTTPAPASAPVPASVGAAAAKTNRSDAEAIELLRRVIKEQQQNPDKVIRTPSSPVSNGEKETKTKNSATTSNNAKPRLTRAELERQFVDGKISAKQFQKAVEELDKNPPPATPKTGSTVGNGATTGSSATMSPKAGSGQPVARSANPVGTAPATGTSTNGVAAEDAPEQKALTDVESKIDEILARREALLRAEKTNAANASATNAVSTAPQTKRQKMDALLRQYIQGKITEQEYNAQREKLVNLPE